MLRPIGMLAAAGFVGVLLTKLLWVLLLPLVGVFIGVLATLLKVALIVGLVWLGFWLFQKITERPAES